MCIRDALLLQDGVEAKNKLQQYSTSINSIYANSAKGLCICIDWVDRGLWANEVNSVSELGDASLTVLQACGVENPVHAGNIIAQSMTPGKWSSI